MKLSRTIILTLIIIAALMVLVTPALAVDQNWSFEVDSDQDGTPDRWTKHGDVLHVCNNPIQTSILGRLLHGLPRLREPGLPLSDLWVKRRDRYIRGSVLGNNHKL